MYNGKYNERQSSSKRAARRRRRRIRNTSLCFALILLLGMAIGGTIAYLSKESGSVVNDFIPAKVEIKIDEVFTDNVKKEIVIENNSNIPVYIRVALVGNWADETGKICINHSSEIPEFTLGTDWVANGGFYYYKNPVAVGGKTADLLDSDIELTLAGDGCSYQLEVIASAIQAQGELDNGSLTAVANAWGIDPSSMRKEVQE